MTTVILYWLYSLQPNEEDHKYTETTSFMGFVNVININNETIKTVSSEKQKNSK